MDADIKREFQVLGDKIDTYMENQSKECGLHRKPLEEHVKDGPRFRDKMVKIGEKVNVMWVLLLMMVGGCVGGFWWLLRK